MNRRYKVALKVCHASSPEEVIVADEMTVTAGSAREAIKRVAEMLNRSPVLVVRPGVAAARAEAERLRS